MSRFALQGIRLVPVRRFALTLACLLVWSASSPMIAAADAPKSAPKTPKATVPVVEKAKATDLRAGAETKQGADASASTGSGSAGSATARDAAGKLPNDAADKRPGFDQGFAGKPTQIEGGQGGNPISRGVGGGAGLGGIAAQGTGAISDGSTVGNTGAGLLEKGGTAILRGSAEVKTDPNKPKAENPFAFAADGKIQEGLKSPDAESQKEQMDSALCDSGDSAACGRQAARAGKAETPASSGGGTPTAGAGSKTKLHPSGNSTVDNFDGTVTQTSADGKTTTTSGNGTVTKTVKNDDGSSTTTTTTVNKDGSATTTTTTTKADGSKTTTTDTTSRPCRGEDCPTSPEDRARFLANNPAVARQLGQAQSGGGGNVDPARGDGEAFVGGSGGVPASGGSLGLVGNPGQRGGMGTTGSVDTSTDFGRSQGAGSINPGQDGTLNTSGGRDQNPADALAGSQPRRDDSRLSSGTGSSGTTPRPGGFVPGTVGSSTPIIECVKNSSIPALRCPD